MDEFLVSRTARRLAASTSDCPPADALGAALDGRLPEAEQAALDVHLVGCEVCATVVRDAATLRQGACPEIAELLRTADAALEPHVALCSGCARIAAYRRTHPDEAATLVDLLEAQSRVRALGAAVSATTILAALLARRASLGPAALGRVHRAVRGTLGTSSARPGLLRWTPLDQGEDTYVVVLSTDHGEMRVRTHETRLEIDAGAWSQLKVTPGKAYRWGITAMRNGRHVDTQEGWLRFISDQDLAALREQEAAARALPTALDPDGWGAVRAMLALASLYRSCELYWEACDVLWAYIQRNPVAPVGHLLLAEIYEDMDRVQEAARAMGQANRLLNAA